jgi:hypothetical protein
LIYKKKLDLKSSNNMHRYSLEDGFHKNRIS